LYQLYVKRVHYVVQKQLHWLSPSEIEEITQEIFLKAYMGLFKAPRDLYWHQWLYKITHNACIDMYRKTRNISHIPLEDLENVMEGNRAENPLFNAQVYAWNKVTSAYHSLDSDAYELTPEVYWHCIDEIVGRPLLEREITNLSYLLMQLQGYSYDEIALRFNVTLASVKLKIFRIRAFLRETLVANPKAPYQEFDFVRRAAAISSQDTTSIEVAAVTAKVAPPKPKPNSFFFCKQARTRVRARLASTATVSNLPKLI